MPVAVNLQHPWIINTKKPKTIRCNNSNGILVYLLNIIAFYFLKKLYKILCQQRVSLSKSEVGQKWCIAQSVQSCKEEGQELGQDLLTYLSNSSIYCMHQHFVWKDEYFCKFPWIWTEIVSANKRIL